MRGGKKIDLLVLLYRSLIAGILPFGAVFVELFFILSVRH